jgi:hypothetical protein
MILTISKRFVRMNFFRLLFISHTFRPVLRFGNDSINWRKRIAIPEESADLLRTVQVCPTPITFEGPHPSRFYVPLDIDVSPFDNSGTKKEGVSRTYKGIDGYSPAFAYLGQEGYGVHVQLREGKDHCQNQAPSFLAESIRYTKRVTDQRLLIRMDSGYDCQENIKVCLAPETNADFIIKRNPRKEKPETWLMIAQRHGMCCHEREGKKVYRGALWVQVKGIDRPIRQVFEVVERTIDKDGQLLLVPDITFETWWTLLPDPASAIIDLYHDHGTSEQFHSELKTDLGIERLPSGLFATNNLVLHLALFAYNLLRIIGQESLKEDDHPLRKRGKSRRIRTVIQTMITLASKVVRHARQFYLRFGRTCAWFPGFTRIYQAFLH